MIAFDEPKKRHARIEIIPMIDVMMFLLVFFVLISLNVIPSQGLNTDLPQSKTAARQVADHPIVVTIGPEGQLQVAGQYVDFILKDGRRRSYSIANPPELKGTSTVELHIRHLPGGLFTDRLFGGGVKEREVMRFEGPLGTFYLREDSDKPIVFVASGTGFAPIKAILDHAFRRGITRPITLYWGGRRPKDLYLASLAEQWAKDHANFKFVPVISDALPEDAWTGRTGFVHQAVMADFPDLSGHEVYACGVPVMVDAAQRDFLAQCGLPEDAFFADSFLDESSKAATSAQ